MADVIGNGSWRDPDTIPESMYIVCSLTAIGETGRRKGTCLTSVQAGLKHNEKLVKFLAAVEIVRKNREEWHKFLENPETAECHSMQIFKTDRALAFALVVGENLGILHLQPGDTNVIQVPDSLLAEGERIALKSKCFPYYFGGPLAGMWIRLGHPDIPFAPYARIYNSIRMFHQFYPNQTISLVGLLPPEVFVGVRAQETTAYRPRRRSLRISTHTLISGCLNYAGVPCSVIPCTQLVELKLDRLRNMSILLYAMETHSGVHTFLSHLHRSWPQMVEPTIMYFRRVSVQSLAWTTQAAKNIHPRTFVRMEIPYIEERTPNSWLLNKEILQHVHDKLLRSDDYASEIGSRPEWRGVLLQLANLDLVRHPVYAMPDHFDVTPQTFVHGIQSHQPFCRKRCAVATNQVPYPGLASKRVADFSVDSSARIRALNIRKSAIDSYNKRNDARTQDGLFSPLPYLGELACPVKSEAAFVWPQEALDIADHSSALQGFHAAHSNPGMQTVKEEAIFVDRTTYQDSDSEPSSPNQIQEDKKELRFGTREASTEKRKCSRDLKHFFVIFTTSFA